MARSTSSGPSTSGGAYDPPLPSPPTGHHQYQQQQGQHYQPQQLYGLWAQGYIAHTPPVQPPGYGQLGLAPEQPLGGRPGLPPLPPGARRPDALHPHASRMNTQLPSPGSTAPGAYTGNPFDSPSQESTPAAGASAPRPRVNTGHMALPNPYNDIDDTDTPIARSNSQGELDAYAYGGYEGHGSVGREAGGGGGLRPQHSLGHSVSHANLRTTSQTQQGATMGEERRDRPPSYTPADEWALSSDNVMDTNGTSARVRTMSHSVHSRPAAQLGTGWGEGSSTIGPAKIFFPMPQLQLPDIGELNANGGPSPPDQHQRHRYTTSIGQSRPPLPPLPSHLPPSNPPPPPPKVQSSHSSSSGSVQPPPRPATGPPRPSPPSYSYSDNAAPSGGDSPHDTGLGRAKTYTASSTPSSGSPSGGNPYADSSNGSNGYGYPKEKEGRGSASGSRPSTSSNSRPPPTPLSPIAVSSGASSPTMAGSSKSNGGRYPSSQPMSFHNASIASFHSGKEGYQDALASPVDSSFSFDQDESSMTSELTTLTQDMEENIRRFQNNELAEPDQEWHKLVPSGALEALSKDEIARQSTIFELFKAEREYVADLELIDEVFVKGLKEANPPVIPEHQVDAFVNEVFLNYKEILRYHKEMLTALFERQRDQHPLVNDIGDIVLSTALKPEFRDAYETYIKANVLAESLHQKQCTSNPSYVAFLQSASSDPRIKKRDIKIFLARPVTRLPRLRLLLEAMMNKTDPEHVDKESLPIALDILGDCVKSSQPGIEAAQSRVNFMDICEQLVFGKGEIIDLDLWDKERHLVHAGPVWTKEKPDTGFSSERWVEQHAALLDNAFIIYREKRISPTVTKKYVVRRPIALSFVRLASFTSEPHQRKEDSGILDFREKPIVPMYPLTIFNVATMQAYNLFVASEAMRKKWHSSFVDALGIFQVKQESNPWFSQNILSDGFFRVPRDTVTRATGKLTCAAPFITSHGRFLAVATTTGIYVGKYGSEESRKIFSLPNALYIAALPSPINKFIVHFDTNVLSYSLDTVALVVLGQANGPSLESSRERVTPPDQSVLFIRHLVVGDQNSGKSLLIYSSKKRLSSSCYIHAIEALPAPMMVKNKTVSFKPLGQPGTIPKDAYDVSSLTRTIGVCTKDGIVTADPTKFTSSASPPIPVLTDASVVPAVALLKSQIDASRPLGFLRVSSAEILVVYEHLGCYINTKGVPIRSSGFLKWETRITSYAARSPYLFLISSRYVEIRNIGNGRLLQVIEGGDIRLLYGGTNGNNSNPNEKDNVLVAMRGRMNDKNGLSEKIVELVSTDEIGFGGGAQRWAGPPGGSQGGDWALNGQGQGNGNGNGLQTQQQLWSEWDM